MLELTDLKTYLKITDSSSDNQLNLAISSAIGFLKDYLWYSLELDEARVAIFYWMSNAFEFKMKDIIGVSQIKYAIDEFAPSFITYTMANNSKVFLERWLVKTRDYIWPYTEITYSAGYDSGETPTNPTPAGLKAILLDISAMYFKNMGQVSIWDIKSETVDGDSIAYKDVVWSLSENALTLLDSYKLYDFSA